MFSLGNHDMEHERLIRLSRIVPAVVAALPAATTANSGQRINYQNIDWYSDGTRWLSVARYPLALSFNSGITSPISASTTAVLGSSLPDETYKVYVEKAVLRNITNTTLDATNNWTLELWRQNNSSAGTMLGSYNTYQTGRVAGNPYVNVITVNAAISLVTDAYLFFISATKNAAPGTLTFVPSAMWFRLIAV